MAATNFNALFSSIALTASVAKTVVSIKAPDNINLRIKGFEIWFHGTDGSHEPVKVELVKYDTDGTGTSLITGTNLNKINMSQAAIQATGKHTYTVEPTGPEVKINKKIHPQGGIVQFMAGEDYIIPNGEIWGLRVTAANNNYCTGALFLEE